MPPSANYGVAAAGFIIGQRQWLAVPLGRLGYAVCRTKADVGHSRACGKTMVGGKVYRQAWMGSGRRRRSGGGRGRGRGRGWGSRSGGRWGRAADTATASAAGSEQSTSRERGGFQRV